jgi:hypothetical protein
MRGQIFNIDGTRIYTFGGGESTDKDMRIQNNLWWKEEIPSPEEMTEGAKILDECGRQVDYIITHEPPLFARDHITRKLPLEEDYQFPAVLDEWYALAEQAPNLKKWYFGHVHVDQKITPRLRSIYNEVLQLTEERSIRWW